MVFNRLSSRGKKAESKEKRATDPTLKSTTTTLTSTISSDDNRTSPITTPFVKLEEDSIKVVDLPECQDEDSSKDEVDGFKKDPTLDEDEELSNSARTEFKQKVQKCRRHTEEGSPTLQALAFLGGLITIFSSIHGVQEHGIENITASYMFISFYSWIFGMFIVCMEGRVFLFDIISLHRFVSNYLKILRFMWGRGLLYIFVGNFHTCLMSQYSIYCGGYMMVVGTLTFTVGLHRRSRLKKLLKQSKKKNLAKHVFDFYDNDKDGYIGIEGFRDLVIGLGFTNTDTDSDFKKIDSNNDGLVAYPEVKEWVDSVDNMKKTLLDDFDVITLYYAE